MEGLLNLWLLTWWVWADTSGMQLLLYVWGGRVYGTQLMLFVCGESFVTFSCYNLYAWMEGGNGGCLSQNYVVLGFSVAV